MRISARLLHVVLAAAVPLAPVGPSGRTPDGREIRPAGFTAHVGRFASSEALSPDGAWLAVLAQDDGAVDILDSRQSETVLRLEVPSATGMTWTADGLYVTQGYLGKVARYAYRPAKKGPPEFAKRDDLDAGPGLLNGVAEETATHRVAVARTADREVVEFDDLTGAVVARHATTGQPFGVAIARGTVFATLYDRDRLDAFPAGASAAVEIAAGPHPTAILTDGTLVYAANADGHDVTVADAASLAVVRTIDLARTKDAPPGQTPAGMALSDDGKNLFVAESGFDDVAVVDLASGRVAARVPAGWYPISVAFARRPTVEKKDPRPKPQLWVLSAKGFGAQSDAAGEDNADYGGVVQHLVVEPGRFAGWTAQADRESRPARVAGGLPPVRHVVFIVKENKHFDEEFGDDPRANADPALVLYGETYTPNAHALARRYTLFDDFMGDGEASVYGHSWTTQAFCNDYNERNAHSRSGATGATARVAYSIWPYAERGEDAVAPDVMDFDWYADLDRLPEGPRTNPSAVFGPRGELVDELQRRGLSYRVYGEQMTMRPDGTIAPGLAAHAARDYPGTHIDFGTRDTVRAKRFIADLARNGLASYTYLTLPTDHTAGSAPGLLTPASYVADNDQALGEVVQALSRRPEWRETVVVVTTDDPSGTGDHISGQRMPVYAIGPYVRRGFVDSTRYSLPSVARTVELVLHLAPLSVFDARATPMTAAFASTPDLRPYTAIPARIPIVANPGSVTSRAIEIDGPDSKRIPDEEWASIRGPFSLASHRLYLRELAARAEDQRRSTALAWLPPSRRNSTWNSSAYSFTI